VTISSIPSTTVPATQAAPKYTPAEVVENFVASVESSAITEILGGGTDSGASGLAGLLAGSSGDGSTSGLAALLGGPNASTTVSDPTGLASIASTYDLARSAAALGVNPFDQPASPAAVGSTVDASA
jgi:hypothetical protein